MFSQGPWVAGLSGVRCVPFSGTHHPISWTPGLPNSAYFAPTTRTHRKGVSVNISGGASPLPRDSPSHRTQPNKCPFQPKTILDFSMFLLPSYLLTIHQNANKIKYICISP